MASIIAICVALSVFMPLAESTPSKKRLRIPSGGSNEMSPQLVEDNSAQSESSISKYLVATFPDMRQVGYVRLPDTIWRPLVIGPVQRPQAVALDSQNKRLFVSDPPSGVIWWFPVIHKSDGLLETGTARHAAVEGYSAHFLTVNGIGDLYFSGQSSTDAPGYDSVFRQDAVNLATGNAKGCVEVYQRANTGNPVPKAFMPSGVAVDSFNVYWGNGEQGQQHGSVVKGSRLNFGVNLQELSLLSMSNAVEEVQGVTATGTHIFYLSPRGVYGMSKTSPSTISDPSDGLISSPPAAATKAWQPVSIAWDGEGSLFMTDAANGVIYSLPSRNTRPHNLTKFVDAPGVRDISIVAFRSFGMSLRPLAIVVTVCAFLQL